MEKIKKIGKYQKSVLVFVALMVLIFTAVESQLY